MNGQAVTDVLYKRRICPILRRNETKPHNAQLIRETERKPRLPQNSINNTHTSPLTTQRMTEPNTGIVAKLVVEAIGLLRLRKKVSSLPSLPPSDTTASISQQVLHHCQTHRQNRQPDPTYSIGHQPKPPKHRLLHIAGTNTLRKRLQGVIIVKLCHTQRSSSNSTQQSQTKGGDCLPHINKRIKEDKGLVKHARA